MTTPPPWPSPETMKKKHSIKTKFKENWVLYLLDIKFLCWSGGSGYLLDLIVYPISSRDYRNRLSHLPQI